ncbi:MAG: (2Fe-2S)-binding protein [Frankiaceae bacterium]
MIAPRPVRLTVNGRPVEVVVEPRELLADTLRDRLRLTGVHLGCGHGSCGACAVLIDGIGTRACLVLTVQLEGAAVTTVEGIAAGGERGAGNGAGIDALHPVQVALSRYHGLQCGFCTPGVVMTAVELLAERTCLDERAVRDRLAGQLCRCTGYAGMVEAVLAVARDRAAEAQEGAGD